MGLMVTVETIVDIATYINPVGAIFNETGSMVVVPESTYDLLSYYLSNWVCFNIYDFRALDLMDFNISSVIGIP